jgi:hypothetical protein
VISLSYGRNQHVECARRRILSNTRNHGDFSGSAGCRGGAVRAPEAFVLQSPRGKDCRLPCRKRGRGGLLRFRGETRSNIRMAGGFVIGGIPDPHRRGATSPARGDPAFMSGWHPVCETQTFPTEPRIISIHEIPKHRTRPASEMKPFSKSDVRRDPVRSRSVAQVHEIRRVRRASCWRFTVMTTPAERRWRIAIDRSTNPPSPCGIWSSQHTSENGKFTRKGVRSQQP